MVEFHVYNSEEFSGNIDPYLNSLAKLNIQYFLHFNNPQTIEEGVENILRSDILTFAVDQSGNVVGFVTIEKFEGNLELATAFVSPEFRGRGLWNDMCAMILERAKDRGRPYIMAMSSSSVVSKTLHEMGFRGTPDSGSEVYLRYDQ